MCAFQIRKRKKEKKVRDREEDSSSVGEAKKARESEGR